MTTSTTTGGRGTEQFIADTAQAQFGDTLRVGAGNIWEDEYTAADGTQTTGLTAGLWFFIRDQPELNQTLRVHKGQQVEVAGYKVTILDVDDAGITLNVLLPPPAP